MKKFIILYGTLMAFMIHLQSCQVAEELDDYKPLYSLETSEAINTQETAELALVGAYASFTQSNDILPYFALIPGMLSGYNTPGNLAGEFGSYFQNDPMVDGATRLPLAYKGLYDLINRSNWIVELVGELDDDIFEPSSRRQEIIAEAKTLRALGHFYLLRYFGEFYDLDSEYGVVVRLEPARSAVAKPRSTVLETYNAILEDLNDGISMGPVLRSKEYTNTVFAKALKAKVLLYMNRFEESAILAQEVIMQSPADFNLESTYADIFDDHDTEAIFESSEILFGTSGVPIEIIGMGNFYSGHTRITQQYIDATRGSLNVNDQMILIDGSQRVEKVFFLRSGSNNQYGTTKYTTYLLSEGGNYEMFYHMRMAEVYLILAEASARANNRVTPEALNALNEVRLRAGATSTGVDGFETYPQTISLDQFLTANRYEKLAELHAETGEPWFDLIRYAHLDQGFNAGFMVSDVKPTATNPGKFILPIPQSTIDAGGNVVIQNPGYTN